MHDIVDITLAIGKIPDELESYFGDGSRFDTTIEYSTESVPLGTAGAVKNVGRLLDGPFVVFNGDVFTDIDLTAMMDVHQRRGAIATLALTPVDDPTAYGVVETDDEGRVTRFLEKPSRDEVTSNLINAGILPLTFDDENDYELLDQGDEVVMENIPETLTGAKELYLFNRTKNIKIRLKYTLSHQDIQFILAGGKLNYLRE